MVYNDRSSGGADDSTCSMQAALARVTAPVVQASSAIVEAAARPQLDAIARKVSAIGPNQVQASSAIVEAAARSQLDAVARKVSALGTNQVQTALTRAIRISPTPKLFAQAPILQLPRIWQPPQWLSSGEILPRVDVGYPGAPDAILEIMERLAELRTLPRLKGLTRRASQAWFDVYDALHAWSREAVESLVSGPVVIPRRYRRGQCERAKILRLAVLSPRKRLQQSIGHLQIRAPGSSGFTLESRSCLVLDGEKKWMTNLTVGSPRLTPV